MNQSTQRSVCSKLGTVEVFPTTSRCFITSALDNRLSAMENGCEVGLVIRLNAQNGGNRIRALASKTSQGAYFRKQSLFLSRED